MKGDFEMGNKSSFELVADMNTAFGNPKGDYEVTDTERLCKQMLNVIDELGEFFIAAGGNESQIKAAVSNFKQDMAETPILGDFDLLKARDAMCDIQVFAMGGQHLMGVDGDADMRAVVAGVMTRFIKNSQDLNDTIAYHAARGVTKVYFEGEFPTMVMKSAEDQPDAPKGKFLKSASFSEPVFPAVKVSLPAGSWKQVTHRIYKNDQGDIVYSEPYAPELRASVYLTEWVTKLFYLYNDNTEVHVGDWDNEMGNWVMRALDEANG